VAWGVNESLTLDVVAPGFGLWTDRRLSGGRLPFARRACDTASQMDLSLTLALAGGLAALAVFAGWQGARPPNPHKGPRMVPWRFVMVTATAIMLPMLVHLAYLLGLTRG
jgi:hypothetical protein